MGSWDSISFIHVLLIPYLTPPDVVCLIFTSRECNKVFDTADSWRTVTKACFGPMGGSRGHLSRRLRRRKVAWVMDGTRVFLKHGCFIRCELETWRAGDGAKARLSLLYLERTREVISRLRDAHIASQRDHERRWVLKQAAAVMRTCAYASRNSEDCKHDKIRLWTSATAVAANPSYRGPAKPLTHPGVRCDRCKSGPITGSCFRCAAGCRGSQQPRLSVLASKKELTTGSVGREACAGSFEDGLEGTCYTLCETCFSQRSSFHPPHPFARLRACFADTRLSGPLLYEAVCGDCLFGSLIHIRPLRLREAREKDGSSRGSGRAGSDNIFAVSVRVEAAGPLPLSQVRNRIAAGDRDDNRGLAFVSEKWQLQGTLLDEPCSP